jgi:uncharacterized membrane protein
MTQTTILPIIALFALVIKSLWGIELTEDVQTVSANAIFAIITGGITLWGIFKDHTKKDA